MNKALTLLGGDKTKETAKFVSMLDKFFDALNVTNFLIGKQQRKPFKDPYRSANDFRLNVSHSPLVHRVVYLIIHLTAIKKTLAAFSG